MPVSNPAADLIVRNGTIVDGSGNEPFVGDVAIRDGKIVRGNVAHGLHTVRVDLARGMDRDDVACR